MAKATPPAKSTTPTKKTKPAATPPALASTTTDKPTERKTNWRIAKPEKSNNVPDETRKGTEIVRQDKNIVKSEPKPALAPLNAKQMAFADEYLIDLNGTQAAIRVGYSVRTANEQAARLLADVRIRKYIDERQAARLVRVEIDQDAIVRQLLNVVQADANELVEYRRTCCRFCHGDGFLFQRTANEMAVDRQEHEDAEELNDAKPAAQRKIMKPFDEKGGIGYDKRKPPHQDCAECFGQGIGSTFVKDTRLLSPAARALYAGVKQTKDGLEIKMHDKQGFVQLLMRHAGMLNDKLKLQGDVENPLTLLLKQVGGTALPIIPGGDDE